MGKWCEHDIDVLKNNYGVIELEELQNLLQENRSIEAIKNKIKRLGIHSHKKWNESEIKILKTHYGKISYEELSNMLPNRTIGSIKAMANRQGLESLFEKHPEHWHDRVTDEVKEFVKNNYLHMTDKEIGEVLGKSETSINNLRWRLKLNKPKSNSYSKLCEFIRKNNWDWKRISAEKCNGRCVITGEEFEDIHHIRGMNLILLECMSELDIEDKEYCEYTYEELMVILKKYKEVQSRYPYGACLTKEMHKKFHIKYGYGNNTQEQWDEFLKQQKLVS